MFDITILKWKVEEYLENSATMQSEMQFGDLSYAGQKQARPQTLYRSLR
jgi:hypothetical protein